jgi:hypothetical protein
MALVECEDCGHGVSNLARACPQCGRPIAMAAAGTPSVLGGEMKSKPEPTLPRGDDGHNLVARVGTVPTVRTMRFRNPANGYVEELADPGLWSFLFGAFYFASKGVWTHAVIGLVLAMPTFGLSCLIYCFFATGIMRKYYLSKGWSEEPSIGGSSLLGRLTSLTKLGVLTSMEFQSERARLFTQPHVSMADRLDGLERLASMKKAGVVTDEELCSAKAESLK